MAEKFILLNDVEKKLLSDRYLDLQFEQDIDDYVCVRCDRLAVVHFFTNCGHLLCLNCKRIIDNGGFNCPQCNTLITDASEHRNDFERQLLALRTKCPNTKYGCQLTINLAQIPEHVGMCKFTREQALPALSTESNTMFSVLDKVNEMNGQIVELKMGFTKMNKQLMALEKYKDELKMELGGLRSDINMETRERKEDSNQLKKEIAVEIKLGIETSFKKLIADEFRAMKEDVKKINLENSTMKKEIANINDKVTDLEQKQVLQKDKELDNIKLPKIKDPIEEFLMHKSSVSQLLDSLLFGSAEEEMVTSPLYAICGLHFEMVFERLCLTFTIDHVKIPVGKSGTYMSDAFPVYGYQLKAQFTLTIGSNENINLHLCFKDEEREGQEVDIKPLPIVTFIIKDLSGQNNNFFANCYISFKQSLEYNEFGYGISIPNFIWNALIHPHDKLIEILVLVEPPTIINSPLSVNGTITDIIEHYSRKLEMAKKRLIGGHWSPPFLTHAGGFRVAVVMWLNGYIVNNKRGLKVGLRFMSGEFDSQLGWDFKHEISITLINQLDVTKNITVKKQATEAYSYDMEIASGDAISSRGFLVNDSLKYHVTIKLIT